MLAHSFVRAREQTTEIDSSDTRVRFDRISRALRPTPARLRNPRLLRLLRLINRMISSAKLCRARVKHRREFAVCEFIVCSGRSKLEDSRRL